MVLQIRQRVFSWTDTYDVYDEQGNARYFVRAEWLAFGHQIHVYDKASGIEVGSVHQKLLTFLPTFENIARGAYIGKIKKEFSFLTPRYSVDYRGWRIEGDFWQWNYQVLQGEREVMSISKKPLSWSDTYALEYANPVDELMGLLLVIAVDAANCNEK